MNTIHRDDKLPSTAETVKVSVDEANQQQATRNPSGGRQAPASVASTMVDSAVTLTTSAPENTVVSDCSKSNDSRSPTDEEIVKKEFNKLVQHYGFISITTVGAMFAYGLLAFFIGIEGFQDGFTTPLIIFSSICAALMVLPFLLATSIVYSYDPQRRRNRPWEDGRLIDPYWGYKRGPLIFCKICLGVTFLLLGFVLVLLAVQAKGQGRVGPMLIYGIVLFNLAIPWMWFVMMKAGDMFPPAVKRRSVDGQRDFEQKHEWLEKC